MDFLQSFILGIIQGFTEFIPISSSGHLALFPRLLGWSEQSTSFDVVLHGGTLLSLIIFFFPKLKQITKGIYNRQKEEIDFSKKIIIGIIPALIIGFFISIMDKITDNKVDELLKNNLLMIFMLFFIGILLILSDKIYKKNDKTIQNLSFKSTFFIGLMQILSLLRGTSRSGITIFAGLSQGMTRKQAAEFSFLMGIPLIAVTFFYQIFEMFLNLENNIDFTSLLIGFFSSFLSGLIAIKFMLKFVEKKGLSIFGIYRIILAIVAFVVLIL